MLPSTLLLLVLPTFGAAACLQFFASVSGDDGSLGASLYNDGNFVCYVERKHRDKQPLWMGCFPGHHSFIFSDWKTVVYATDRKDFRLSVSQTEKMMENPGSNKPPSKWLYFHASQDCPNEEYSEH